jgi:hypothetical protein
VCFAFSAGNAASAAESNKRKCLIMRTKNNPPNGGSISSTGNPADGAPFRNNPEVDAKIDGYIKENPNYWAYVQAMPRERLERSLVLNEVRELDRQHRMREGIMKRINANPSLKQAYETLVKNVPEEQRENVIAQLARQTRRAEVRAVTQQQTKGETVGV